MSSNEADLTVVELIHRAIRRDLGQFADQPREQGSEAGDTYWSQLAGQIHHHHEVEDDEVWGIVISRCGPDAGDITARMEEQHQQVVALLEALESAPSRDPETLRALERTMREHLDDEEATAFPLIRQAFSFEEMAEFGQRQLMVMSEPDRGFFLPWILWEAPAASADSFRGVLPPPIIELIDSQLMPAFIEGRLKALG